MIPVNTPALTGNEEQYLQECIQTTWISSEGPFVRRLEEGFSASCGRKHGIAVCNGTAALQVAVEALELGPGDEVILPTLTIISCAAAIVRAGAIPVAVDCDPHTWNMTADLVEAAITPRTKAIMAVHIYGLPVHIQPILTLAEKHGLKVIEDAAEAIGQTCEGQTCGGFGDISIVSFYPNKHITTGEGGMVLTNDDTLAERCRNLRNLFFGKQRRFEHEELGYNFRMSNMQAAVGVAQFEQLPDFILRKREIGLRYQRKLQGHPSFDLPLDSTAYADNLYWIFGLVLSDDLPFEADEAMAKLAAHKVGTRPFFWCMHEQPVFKKMGLFREISCPVAERLARRGFYVPSGLGLRDEDIDTVADLLHSEFTA